MLGRDARRTRINPRLIAGLALLLLYAVPLFVPPSAQPLVTPAADASLLARVFPNVPHWWMVGRLIALLTGALLLASLAPAPVVSLPPIMPDACRWTRPWVRPVAWLAAALQVACLPWLSRLPPIGQDVFMIWFAVPGALLAWGSVRTAGGTRPVRKEARSTMWFVAAIIVFWCVCRVPVSWHSPRAADGVDMWRTFGRLVQIAATKANFLTESMDPQLPGVTCLELFFHGLPLLEIASHAPSLTFEQLNNTCLLAALAAILAALCASIVSPTVAPIATAAFLFSPLTLIFQLYPLSAAGWLLMTALLALLLLKFVRGGSAATLALLGAVAGMTASFPTLAPMTAVVLALVAWRLWRRPRVPFIVVSTAGLSFVAGLVAGIGIHGVDTFREMVNRYYLLHWSWAIGEGAMFGQMTPTIYDWTGPKAPPWYVIPIGTLLSPFAIARNSQRLWGDVMFEPLSAGLFAVGIIACVRHSLRDRMALLMLVFLAAAMVTGFTSTYDRPSQLRLLGASIPLALLAAAGFSGVLAALPGATARRRATMVVALAIAASGTMIFDVVNPRILAASAIGLAVRSVDATDLNHAVLLTANGFHPRTDVDPLHRYWELDWLRKNHPYIDEIVRCVPEHPLPILPFDVARGNPTIQIFLWSPALEETAEISKQVCQAWPDTSLYTIVDAAGLSRVHAAQRKGPGWQPSVPESQWRAVSCAEGLKRIGPSLHFQSEGHPR